MSHIMHKFALEMNGNTSKTKKYLLVNFILRLGGISY